MIRKLSPIWSLFFQILVKFMILNLTDYRYHRKIDTLKRLFSAFLIEDWQVWENLYEILEGFKIIYNAKIRIHYELNWYCKNIVAGYKWADYMFSVIQLVTIFYT